MANAAWYAHVGVAGGVHGEQHAGWDRSRCSRLQPHLLDVTTAGRCQVADDELGMAAYHAQLRTASDSGRPSVDHRGQSASRQADACEHRRSSSRSRH